MNIVYFGSGEFGLESLNAIELSGHHLSFVVTQPAHPAGRGRKLKSTSVAKWAIENNIEYTQAAEVNSAETVELIRSYDPELIVVIAFGQKISKEVIELAPKGAINVHFSLLPKYRGAAPVNWAIVNGEKQTGVSIITLAEKMDAGDIIIQKSIMLNPDENAEQVGEKLKKLAAPLLIQAIDTIEEGSAVYKAQDHNSATAAPKLKKSDAYIDFNEPVELIKRKILGFWPWPGASANYVNRQSGKCVKVTFVKVEIVESADENLSPGIVDKNLCISCGHKALKILKLQPAGQRVMDFKDFCNGRRTRQGDIFMPIDS